MSSNPLRDTIRDHLSSINFPLLEQPLSDLARIADAEESEQGLKLAIEIRIPCSEKDRGDLEEKVKQTLSAAMDKSIDLKLYSVIESHKSVNAANALKGVKNVIAIASGKGGVGKSTTTINLALALAQAGARVGVLDADIFGPSQAMLAGTPPDTRPDVEEQKYFVPIDAHGLQFMSMGFLVTEQTPMVWRGPKASGAMQQMLTQTVWNDLDYLLIDMPPGTSDIQLTLSQSCPLTAAAIVTTPQDIALLDAIKGIEMFRKVHVPILGIIENMSTHVCSECGHAEAIFGEGGGDRIAETYETQLLGQLPLNLKIRQQADEGLPTVAAEPEGDIAKIYQKAALKMVSGLLQLPVNSSIPNVVSIS